MSAKTKIRSKSRASKVAKSSRSRKGSKSLPKSSNSKVTIFNAARQKIAGLLGIVKGSAVYGWISLHRDVFPAMAFAVVPILFFWSKSNIQELWPSMIVRPVISALVFAALIYLVWYIALNKDRYRAGIMAAITAIIVFNYAQIFKQYQKFIAFILDINVKVRSQALFFVLLVIFFAGTLFLVKKKLRYSNSVRNYLLAVPTVLIVLNLYPLVNYWSANFGLKSIAFGPNIEVVNKASGQKPDIYFLMIEDYGSEKTLTDLYGYKNQRMFNYLKSKGFYVASDTTANYPFTTFSLATTFNLDYIPESLRNKEDSILYYTLLKDKIENNKAALFLKSQGYSFTNLGAWWTATKYNKNADKDLYDRSGLVAFDKVIDLKEHEMLLLKENLAWNLFNGRVNIGGKTLFGLTTPEGKSNQRAVQEQAFNHQIETIKQITKDNSPKYVFAHFLLPHAPYVFDSKCNPVSVSGQSERDQFLEQLKCVETRIMETVEYIMDNNATKPIIIVQTDEGPYPESFKKNKLLDWTKASTNDLREKADLLNAYYFPDSNYSKLYQNISPVNSFRVIFDQYFGTDLGLLEDRTYFQESGAKKFFLNDLTDRFK